MPNIQFATVRLGKDSVNEIRSIDSHSPGALEEPMSFSIKCTQVPQEFVPGTFVFMWLGSDNSKGMATAWKQGFRAVGLLSNIVRGESYNSENELTFQIEYILCESISRLDILQNAPQAYFWCSAMPIIGLDDHSNQTVRMISMDGSRSDIKAFLYCLKTVREEFQTDILRIHPELAPFFDYSVPDPRSYDPFGFAADGETDTNGITRCTGGENIILYGVPGSGKSWTIEHEYCSDETKMERLVFHPDYMYSDFIGQILPVVREDKVRYEFSPGPFTKLMQRAYADPGHHYYLIIEEINRGNAPAIFGEIFQLLDRITEPDRPYPIGTSEYAITHANIAQVVYGNHEQKVRIPSNFSIIGTMNTSDQNVFTLDTAFQRRWIMRMIPNSFDNHRFADFPILDTSVSWRAFCEAINDDILRRNNVTSSEDKRLGAYFITAADLVWHPEEDAPEADHNSREWIASKHSNARFAEKVLKYLWDDAFKFCHSETFDTGNYKSLETVIARFCSVRGDDRFSVFNEVLRKLIMDSATKYPAITATAQVPQAAPDTQEE